MSGNACLIPTFTSSFTHLRAHYFRNCRGQTEQLTGGACAPARDSSCYTSPIVYQNSGFYSCLECITKVVSGVQSAVAG